MTLDNLAVIMGKNITQLRKEKGMTQKVLAERIDVTLNSIGRMEKGLLAPKMTRIQEIANALDCSASDLFKNEKAILTDKTNALAERMNKLPAEAQKSLLQLIDYHIDLMEKNKK